MMVGDDYATPSVDLTQAVSRSEQPFRALNIDLSDPNDCRFADYELLEKIASGGMGVVYRARQISLDREVAIKLLTYDPLAVDDLVARFRNEARHAGRLQHPNIIPVYEIGTHENLYFFSMGLVRGPTLGRWLNQQEKRSPQVLAQMMRTIAEAVEYAHQVGILHLDLKPGNVMIDERGAAQVGDFGLAHGIQEAEAGLALAAGTPAYMAPEQTRRGGSALSTRTDIWGLGAIFFEMLTGQPPFSGDNAADTLRRVVSKPLVPPRVRDPKVPMDLDAICRHCLAKNPAERYGSAREMADDLQRFLDGRPVSVRTQGWSESALLWRRREPRVAALAVGLLLALLTGLAATSWLWVQADASRSLAHNTLWEARRATALQAQERGDPLVELPALVENVADAELLGSAADAARDRLRIGLLLAQAPRQIASFSFPTEGRSVAFAEQGTLLLAGLRDSQLVALELASQRERWRIRTHFPATAWGPSFVGRIQPTADGRYALLFPSGSSGVARPDFSHMQRVDLRDGTLLQPPAEFAGFSDQSFAQDGKSALLRDRQGGLQYWATDPWRALGPRYLRPALRYCLLTSVRGHAACAAAGFKSVMLMSAASGVAQAELRFASGAELISWSVSADSRWLALGSAASELLLYDLERASSHAVTEAGEGALTDLTFDEGVLSVSGDSGSVRLLELAGRKWLSRTSQTGTLRMNSAQFDLKSHWLLANDGRAVLWKMPWLVDQTGALLPTSVLRHRGALIGMSSTALHGPSALAASFGSEGELKVFRLPPARSQPAMASAVLPFSADLLPPLSSQPRQLSEQNRAYSAQGTADARYWAAAVGSELWCYRAGGKLASRIALPNSVQYLLVHPLRPVALVGSIEASGRLRVRWRTLDLASGSWLSAAFFSDGLLDGVRLDRAGQRFAWWQGTHAEVRRLDDGSLLGSVDLPVGVQRISDASLLGRADSVLLATSARSMLLPGSLQQWQVRANTPAKLLREVHTPTAHTRVFDLGESWLGHGPRVILYRPETRIDLAQLGGDWSDVAALSADQRWLAVAQRDAVRLFDLAHAQALSAAQRLPMPGSDTIAQLGFAQDGGALLASSHFAAHFELPFLADQRPLEVIRREVADLAPGRAEPVLSSTAQERAARDPGNPLPLEPSVASSDTRDPAASAAQIDLRRYANVAPGQRFQGSRRGLGITDSASWPTGLLRLRGVNFELGPALQLAPAGSTLGAAVFPARSGAIALPYAAAKLHLLLSNQVKARAGGLSLHWLDARGNTLARSLLTLSSAWDVGVHEPVRAHQPQADVALVLRTAESRIGGGGSPLLLVYLYQVRVPPEVPGIVALELHASASAPLLLALSADPATQ